MRVLAIDSASSGCRACVCEGGAVVAREQLAAGHGLAEWIAPMVGRLVGAAGAPGLIAVAVGPGSFTGLRAGISVALGLGQALGVEVVGVSAAEAWGDQVEAAGNRTLWTAISARVGRVFIDHGSRADEGRAGSGFAAYALDVLPRAAGRIAVAGDAANAVASVLAARGGDIMLTRARQMRPEDVAAAGVRRHAGLLPKLAAVPLYVDAPEAKLPAGGLRPSPLGFGP